MPFLLGTDEAGYGPNLGPLVVTATVWHVPDRDGDLYELLSPTVGNYASATVPIADSKRLYQPGGGLEALERGVLPAWTVLGTPADSWRKAFSLAAGNRPGDGLELPWHYGYDAVLPRDLEPMAVPPLVEDLRRSLEQAGVTLRAMRAAVVFPREFNAIVDRFDNKASALSHVTLSLVQELLEPLGDEPILVHCDKHGGRNKYGPLLQQQFPDYLVEVVREGRDESSYRFGPKTRRVEMRFVAKGERFLPSALASMVCKYLRELSMLAFNDFWSRHVPGLKPTAGYPEDAKRFQREIADAQQRLGIASEVLWRKR